METQKIESFQVIGIAVRTSNENGQAAQDIPALWGKWMSENLIDQIPNRVDQELYCIYTDYEKDYTRPYTTILGCKVSNLTQIPEGMVGLAIEEANYQKFIAHGNLLEGAVFNEWTKIWQVPIDRAYIADFEVYGEGATDPTNASVQIYIGLKA